MKKLSVVLAALVLAAFGLAACGDEAEENDDETTAAESTTEATAPTETKAAGGGTGAGGTIDLSSPADGSYAYDKTELTVPAGEVTVNYDNPAPLSHDVVIEDDGGTIIGETELISESSTSTKVDLQAGTYTYFCDVPSHREQGMEGSLTVE